MSTFAGKFVEICGISADRFDGKNLNSFAFFLSHCHTDHMVGLNTTEFQEMLKEKQRFLYVSPISKAILKQLYPSIETQIKELDFHTAPSVIQLENNETVCVNLIPSGHCPGSVMFLFESKGKCVLYTGDFRISIADLKNLKVFYDSYGNLKKIHAVYLDTTFFSKSYLKFPPREDSLEQTCSLIGEWIKIDENHAIELKTSAKYGYEYMFMKISEKFNMPVHIPEKTYEFYSLIPEMDGAVTLDGTRTQIHCSCGDSFRKTCISGEKEKFKLRTIKLSAMRWTSRDLKEGMTSNNCKSFYVCYSTHASFEECFDLIQFLKPENVYPSVLSENSEKNQEMYDEIDELCEKKTSLAKKPKLFDVSKMKEKESGETNGMEDNDEFFESAFDSPPR